MIKQLAVIATIAACCSSASIAQTTIERLAPESTVIIAGTKNFQAAKERFQRTPLWSLWQTDQMKTMRADMMKQMGEGLDEMLQDLGVEEDSLVCPTGSVGVAVFSVIDPEMGTPQMAFLAIADYGSEENIEKTNALIQAALARGEEKDELEFEHKDINGRTVYSIDFSKMQNGEDEFDDMNGDMGMMPLPDAEDMFQGVNKLHYVREGNSLLMSTDLDTLTEAIELADGEGAAGQRFADRAEFQAIMSKLGDPDVYGVLLTRDVMNVFAGADPMGMAEMMKPTIRAAFGEVQGYGFGMRMDSPTAMIEQTVTAYMPNGKQGLTTLIDAPAGGAIPAFVGPDAINYSNVTFKFSGLLDVIRKVVASNPMLAGQAMQQVDAVAPMITQITSSLGSQVHMTTSVNRPFTAENYHSLIAIECTNPQEFENFISGFAAQMGIEARDFLGQRIYSMDPDMMMMMPMPNGAQMQPMSLGIGGGFVLLGPTPAVEQGLRATSNPGGATVAAAPEFQRAMAALSKDNAVAWGYSDTLDAIEAMLAIQREAMQQMLDDMREQAAEMDEEDAAFMQEWQAEMEAQMQETMKMWDKLDFKLYRQYIGPSAWKVQSTDDGFVMKAYLLSAEGTN